MVMHKLMLLLGVACAALGHGSTVPLENVYPATTVVVDVDRYNVITVATMTGILYQFTDEDGDWFEGDIASLLMHDGGTPYDVTDDAILKVRYSGWVGDPDTGEGWEDWFYDGWYWTDYMND